MFNKSGSVVAMVATAVMAIASSAASQDPSRTPIDRLQFVHGLAADPVAEEKILLGTEYGLLRASPDGMAEIATELKAAITGLVADPNTPGRLLLSGMSEAGTSAGLLVSGAGVADWAVIPGTAGEDGVVLTSLSVSRLDGAKLVGLGEKIQLSIDGGRNWEKLETTPEKTIAVALSGTEPSRLFAATLEGLLVSNDNGASWQKSFDKEAPATAVASLSGGRVLAFLYGTGLIAADEATLDWRVVATGFEDRYLRILSEDPSRPERLHAVADTGAVLMSRDGGLHWISFEGSDLAYPDRIAAGKALYADYCESCHGAGGIGESPEDPAARDEFGFKAPALNDDMHAWHHSDTGLRATINEGSPRNDRMAAWQDVLSDNEVDEIVAYLKSTWSIRSLACQGARHMACMRQ